MAIVVANLGVHTVYSECYKALYPPVPLHPYGVGLKCISVRLIGFGACLDFGYGIGFGAGIELNCQ